ncbi:hypothetical protein NCPPB3923_26500 [Burkholderia glumae]|nr:hypothetical protein NCPPB3923_26500 [Burkholderia glumae]
MRDLGLIEAFHASVQLERAAPLTTAGELRAIVARKLAEETELCLSPQYFVALAARLGTVGRVQIEIKRGHAANELTRFRYDVTLLGARRDTAEPESVSIDWPALAATDDGVADSCLQALASRLECCGDEPLTVTAIPNRRLVKPLAQRRLLHEATHDTTAWSLERDVWLVDDTHAVDPEAVAGLADRLGLEVRLLVGADGRLDHFDARFSLPRDHTTNLGKAAAGPAFEITGQPS